MPDETVLARIMTALDLALKNALHYHEEGYESDNDYGLPAQVMRPALVCSVLTTEASFNLANYKGAQCPISPFMPRPPWDELPFHQWIYQCLTFDETPIPMPEVDSNDEDFLPTADLHDQVWSKKPVSDSPKCLCIHQIPRPATSPPQSNEVEMPLEPE